VLTLCLAIAATCSLDRVLLSIAIIPMSEQYEFSDSVKGLISAAFSLGYFVGLPATGAASTLGSPKRVLLGGLILWSLAQAGTPAGAAVSVPCLLATRGLMGVGEAAAIPSLQAVAGRFVPPERRSFCWGCLAASLSCGTIAAYLISPPLMDMFGWEAAFELFGGLGLAVALGWAIWGADAPACDVIQQCEVPDQREAQLELDDVPWRQIATSRPVWALAAAHASSNTFMYFGFGWLPTYFSYEFDLSTADASYASLLPYIAGAIGALVAGAACDALVARGGLSLTRARKAMQSIALAGPMLAMTVLCALSAGAGGLHATRDEAEFLFIFALACQAGAAAGFGCGAQDIATRYSSLIYGVTSATAVVAGALGQYLTGVCLEATGRDFAPIFGLVAAVELAGLVAWNCWWSSERIFE
jgi:ACS family sodium-dependent inorganic phosphate cotransporter